MIPPTINGLPTMECLSAMQKCIRRGMEREAMEFAVELIHTSKGFTTMVCNRLEITCHEDIDTIAQPFIVPYVHSTCEAARRFYKPEKLGASRMMIGNVIRLLSRAAKSREGDHFHCAVGLAAQQDGFVPTVPDWAKDMHTYSGRRMGRGIEHFLTEGTRLEPEPKPDAYAAEAHRRWRAKHNGKGPGEGANGADSARQASLNFSATQSPQKPEAGGEAVGVAGEQEAKPQGPQMCPQCRSRRRLKPDPHGGEPLCRGCIDANERERGGR